MCLSWLIQPDANSASTRDLICYLRESYMAFVCAYIVLVDHMFLISERLYVATGAGTSSLEQTYIDCHAIIYIPLVRPAC